jgi:hypothetical protein
MLDNICVIYIWYHRYLLSILSLLHVGSHEIPSDLIAIGAALMDPKAYFAQWQQAANAQAVVAEEKPPGLQVC